MSRRSGTSGSGPCLPQIPVPSRSSEVRRFITAADRAAAFVLASPNYHNSYSGLSQGRALGGIAIPTQFVTTDSDWREGTDGYELQDEQLGLWLNRFLDGLISIATRLGPAQR